MKFLQKRIPTLLGLIIIIIGLSITTLASNNKTIIQTSAEEIKQPLEVRITNITDTSFTVSYKTNGPTGGVVSYGINSTLNETAFDENDTPGNIQERTLHSITVHNLTPSTKYFFTILSGGEQYLNNNQDFEITTSTPLLSKTVNQTIHGKIINPDSTIPKEAIIYVTAENSQVVSSLIKNDGSYVIPLDNLLESDLSKGYEFLNDTPIKIFVLGTSLESNAIFYYSQSNDLPLITLSQNYDFRYQTIETASSSATLEDFPTFESTASSKPSKTFSPKILSPENNESVSGQETEFKGTGLPNEEIQISIHSAEKIQTSVKTDSNGNWTYTPSSSLSPGTHTITIIAKDASGILRTITQSFVVYAAENNTVSETPTLTPTLFPTFTPTPTTYDINQASSSASISEKPLPPTGNEFIITAGIVGVIISLIGGLLFLLSRET